MEEVGREEKIPDFLHMGTDSFSGSELWFREIETQKLWEVCMQFFRKFTEAKVEDTAAEKKDFS